MIMARELSMGESREAAGFRSELIAATSKAESHIDSFLGKLRNIKKDGPSGITAEMKVGGVFGLGGTNLRIAMRIEKGNLLGDILHPKLGDKKVTFQISQGILNHGFEQGINPESKAAKTAKQAIFAGELQEISKRFRDQYKTTGKVSGGGSDGT